ncbi:hypothetical protein AX16_004068 [Volvariella volvacea WC 439]|nr:hypothetical protein AX16_004068 [Volvariella volvacea WC 439]
MSHQKHYDIVVVGAGIAGSALAHSLSTLLPPLPSTSNGKSRHLNVLLLERSLSEPDRIVGELLQPGGVHALKQLGLEGCLEGIDAIPARGYCVVDSTRSRSVHIPYPEQEEGRSFHHGRFVMKLREAVIKGVGGRGRSANVDVVEGSVTELVEDAEGRVVGVRVVKKNEGGLVEENGSEHVSNGDASSSVEEKLTFRATLTIIADGCFSNFRTAVLGKPNTTSAANLKSHFIGAVLEDAELPIPNTGTVCLVKGSGPVLLYQIGQKDTRILIDARAPLPADLKAHILTNIVPQLPAQLQAPVRTSLAKDRLRRMPNTFLPPLPQTPLSSVLNPFSTPFSSKKGVFLIGDAWNMRHPLTGGGMTVALNDVVLVTRYIGELVKEGRWTDEGVREWSVVERRVLRPWWWERKNYAATINILSVALYDLFGAEDDLLEILRTGCFKYFELGGTCVSEPVSLLSGRLQSPSKLFTHFFTVAFYSIWILLTEGNAGWWWRAWEWPAVAARAACVFWKACVVFGPLMWTEVRWWKPRVGEEGVGLGGLVWGMVMLTIGAGVLAVLVGGLAGMGVGGSVVDVPGVRFGLELLRGSS